MYANKLVPRLHCGGLWLLMLEGTVGERTPHLGPDSAVAAAAAVAVVAAVAAAAAAEAASDAPAPACSAEPPRAARKEGRDSGYPAGGSAVAGSLMVLHLESSGPLEGGT